MKAFQYANALSPAYRELMDQLERIAGGLFLAGHYRDGVSLSDSIVSGCNVAERVENFLRQREEKPVKSLQR